MPLSPAQGRERMMFPSRARKAGMARRTDTLLDELGLRLGRDFLADRCFYLALAVAPVTLLLLNTLLPSWSDGIRPDVVIVLSMVVWQPLVEEVLFRGVLQGQLCKRAWACSGVAGISIANLVVSLLFGAAHLAQHAPGWAAAVIIPSLVFGYFRDRHRQILPSLLLHAAYNGSYLLIGSYQSVQ